MMDHAKFSQGVALFNAADFFAAHEALEDVWREMRGPDKELMQALIQVAVAMHHHSTGNLEGTRSVLARAAATLADAPDELFGIAMAPLRRSLEQWRQALNEGSSWPALPRLQTRC